MKAKAAVVDDERLLTVEETAEQFQVTDRTVRNLATRGELRSTRVGRQFRFKRAWLREYVERNR